MIAAANEPIVVTTTEAHPYLASANIDLKAIGKSLHKSYASAAPFPNIALTNFFNEKMLEEVLSEFPDLSAHDSVVHNNARELKFAGKGERSFGPRMRSFMHFLNSEPFLEFLQEITGIKETLLSDPYFVGGGLHEIKPGGLLKIHADFNKHPMTGLDRRINVLVYLNKDWEEAYGGHFELWDKDMQGCVKKILPAFNTMAIFSTTDFSYHGHPDPLTCPPHMSRKSLALYYYSNGRPASEINLATGEHMTLFKARRGHQEDVAALSVKMNVPFKATLRDWVPPALLRNLKKLKP